MATATHLPWPIPTTATRAQLIADIGLYRTEAEAAATAEAAEDAAEAAEDAAEVLEDQAAAATVAAKDATIASLQDNVATLGAQLAAAVAAGTIDHSVTAAFQALTDALKAAGITFPVVEVTT